MSPFHSGMNHWQRQWLSDRLHKKHADESASIPAMPPPTIFWYKESNVVKNAFLFNCRDQDLEIRAGAKIEKGEIVIGLIGFVAAEEVMPGFFGKVMPFEPTRRCNWQELELRCMLHPNTPTKATKTALRRFNYGVAELPDEAAEDLAKRLGVSVVIHATGKKLINIEIATFQRQGIANSRRAKLL